MFNMTGDNIYNDEQLKTMVNNCKEYINPNGIHILEFVAEADAEIVHNEIEEKSDQAGIGKNMANKILTAFLFAGLIVRRERGTMKVYALTEDGKRVLQLMKNNN